MTKFNSIESKFERLTEALDKSIAELEEFLGYAPGDSEEGSLDTCAIPEDFFDEKEEE